MRYRIIHHWFRLSEEIETPTVWDMWSDGSVIFYGGDKEWVQKLALAPGTWKRIELIQGDV